MLKWPDQAEIVSAVADWVKHLVRQRPDVLGVGILGSYARGDWGVGSDLDLIVLLDEAGPPGKDRSIELDQARFPVPVDLFVYRLAEWERLGEAGARFFQAVSVEAVWVYSRPS